MNLRSTLAVAVTLSLTRGAGFDNGDLSDTMIRNQIRVLNDSYNGRTGANTSFGFELAAKTALRRGGPGTLNIYTVDASPWLGWAYFPSILNTADANLGVPRLIFNAYLYRTHPRHQRRRP